MKLIPSLLAATMAAVASPELQAQVVISEISFESPAWIELRNNGGNEVDVSGWSLYQATKTANRSGNYWWGFPAGTRIKAGDYLRVLWGAPIQAPTDPRDFYTGDKSIHFLFGHGFEKLSPASGAIAVLNTQSNTQMNSVGIVVDWLQWGEAGFKRENLATAASPQLWAANTFIPKGEADMSIALLYDKDANPTPPSAFFPDYTPTPLSHNADEYGVTTDLQPCGYGSHPIVELGLDSDPIHGNKDFALVLNNTRGPAFFEVFMLQLRDDHATSTQYDPLNWQGPCRRIDWTNATTFLWTPLYPTTTGRTKVEVPLLNPAIKGLKLQVQALVGNTSYYVFTNRIFVTLSN